jgi:type I restriction enzyme S subunit
VASGRAEAARKTAAQAGRHYSGAFWWRPETAGGRVVYFDREDGPFSFSNFTSAIRVRDSEAFDSKFVFYALLEFYQSGRTEDIQRRTTGIRNLDFTAYKEQASFPWIPIHEQQKIAGVLGVVQQAIEQQERQLQLTAELKKTLLHQLFTQGLRGEPQKQTEIGPVPESWEIVPLGSLAKIGNGSTPKRGNVGY